jgi:hypothetical protein
VGVRSKVRYAETNFPNEKELVRKRREGDGAMDFGLILIIRNPSKWRRPDHDVYNG